MGGVFTKLIDRNTTILQQVNHKYSQQLRINQLAVDIHVLLRKRPMAADNKTTIPSIDSIPAAPRGIPKSKQHPILIKWYRKCICQRSKVHKRTKITIKSSSGLTDEEIERMVKDAESNAEADKARKEEVDLRNDVDALLFSVDKTSERIRR